MDVKWQEGNKPCLAERLKSAERLISEWDLAFAIAQHPNFLFPQETGSVPPEGERHIANPLAHHN